MRSDAKRRLRNETAFTELKTLDKKLRSLATNPDEARQFAHHVISRYDRAASRGIIHPNRAARKKSRIEKLLAKIKAK
jgi:small subunit ribosomal protein S20